ncbi:MAG: serine hydrolase [Bacteroidetes bacterium]|nr:serine hydrolase [Bacteroidota bacterium]
MTENQFLFANFHRLKKNLVKTFKRTLFIAGLMAFGLIFQYGWRAFPIMSGYSAKDMCSCVFVAGRDPESVTQNELGNFPLSLASVQVNRSDSSATSSVFGLARRKAIYRKGLGCTLVVGLSEDELRNQKIKTYQAGLPLPDSAARPQPKDLPNLNQSKLKVAIEQAFQETTTEKIKMKRTRAIVVAVNGRIVAEKYAEGFDENSKHIGWSMTKSITNALVGILVKQGKLKIDEPAPVNEWKKDDRKNITLSDLLDMSSGLQWEENYSGPSGATNMLFKEKDMGIYAAGYPLKHKPGESFEYSSGTTNIISRIIRQTVGDEDYYQFPYRELFAKIGMHSLVLEPDAGGTFVGSSYSFATARDFARFGLLYLNDGVWNGERILPEGWVKYSSTPTSGAHRGEYGAQWWTNAGEKINQANRTYPNVPADCFQAEGFEGQYIFVVPSKKLVVVRLGLTKTDDFDMNQLVSGIISALP